MVNEWVYKAAHTLEINTMRVVNVVARSNLRVSGTLPLRHIASQIWNVEHRAPRDPHRLYIRFRRPKVTAILYERGFVTLTGARSVEDARRGIRKVARIVQRMGQLLHLGTLVVQTMTVSHHLSSELDLTNLALGYGPLNVRYEPECFAGAIISLGGNAKVTAFKNGKTFLVGCRTEDEVVQCYLTFFRMTLAYRIGSVDLIAFLCQ